MVKNALEATSPREEIVLSCRAARGRRIEFRVYNPAYIPRDIQQQVFQRFFSTKGKDRGLGTYGMRLLSEQYLKGKVSFFSSPEMGTCFLARYPVNLLCEG
jgi:signal transduction histidine kinase